MKGSARAVTVMTWGMILLVTVGTPSTFAEEEFGEILPLFEPKGSPIHLQLISELQPAMGAPVLCPIDLDGDGVMEILTGRDYLEAVALREGRLEHWPVPVLVGFKKFVGPGMEKLGIVSMASGDLDGDGLDDLVVSTWDRKLWVFLNHGRWGFQPAPGAPYGVSAPRVWVHDQNGDGLVDVILSNPEGVFFLENLGGGRLGEKTAVTGLQGEPQAGTAGAYAGCPGFFLLNAEGLWFLPMGELSAELVLEPGGNSLAVSDFRGMGTSDVVIGQTVWRRAEIRFYPGTPHGLGKPHTLSLDHDIAWLLSPDLNGDGWPDLVVGNPTPAGFSVFYNSGGQFLGALYQGIQIPSMGSLPPMDYGAVFGDMDGDGKDELAVSLSLNHVAIFGVKVPGRVLIPLPGSFILGSVDLNRDGLPDLLTSTLEGGVAALYSLGTGYFRTEILWRESAGRMPYLAELEDINGDGKEELVLFEFAEEWVLTPKPGEPQERKLERSKARVTVWNLEKGEALWSEPLGEEVRPVLVLSDQTGDGIPDAVSAVGNKLVILAGTPKPQRKEVLLDGLAGPLVELPDGSIAGFSLSDRTELFILSCGEYIETGVSLEISPLDLIVCDLNADGNEELVSLGWGVHEGVLSIMVAVLWNEGDSGFAPQIFPIESWPATSFPFPYGGLVAGDLDGNGRIELAATRLPDQEGNPGGIVVIPWTEREPGEIELLENCVGTRLLAMDVDSDGRDEFLTAQIGIPAYLCLMDWR